MCGRESVLILSHFSFRGGGNFREEFSNIGEARSIIPRYINVMALTATATKATREFVQQSLCMTNCSVIQKLPNRLNIKYTVQSKPDDVVVGLSSTIDNIAENGVAAEKTVVFCRTYSECCMVFEVLVNELGNRNSLFVDGTKTICNMFTAVSDIRVKDAILTEFVNSNSYLRVVVATIVFGMGLDAPDITRVIHWGPSHNIEAYVQESGRSGRNGRNAIAELYYEGKDFAGSSGPSPSMKAYCKNTDVCRRQQLMEHFDSLESTVKPIRLHECCDVCAPLCNCTHCTARELCDVDQQECSTSSVTEAQKKEIQVRIKDYRLRCCSSDHDQCMLFGIEIVSGILDCIIETISSNAHLCTIDYLQTLGVSAHHAIVIYDIVCNVLVNL